MYNFLLLIFFINACILICLIMLQQEKNADIKSSFNVSSNNLFSPKNTENNINKIIKILAILFIFMSLLLNNLMNLDKSNKKWENLTSDISKKTEVVKLVDTLL